MLYARHSLNYQVSIRVVRRGGASPPPTPSAARPLVPGAPTMLRSHLDNAERVGLGQVSRLDNFTHRSTDGPLNPFARVYSLRDVAA